MKLVTLAAVLCLVFTGNAFADDAAPSNDEPSHSKGGLFIEPGVTYELGDSKITYPAPFSPSTGKIQGWGLTARVGFHINDMFFAAIEGRYSQPKYTDSAFGYDATSVATSYGPTVGIQTPVVGLRVWGTWVLGGDLDPKGSAGYDVKFSKATGYRVGAGFRVAIVSLNLEYQQLKYKNASLESVGSIPITGSFSSVEPHDDAWIASVSFPLDM